MLQQPNPLEVAKGLQRHLNSDFPILVIPKDDVPRTLIRRLKFSPDICLRRGEERILVHLLSAGKIPAWVRRARKHIRKDLNVLLLALSARYASEVAEDAQRLGFGLALMLLDELLLVFGPQFKASRASRSAIEVGHIPKWLYERAAAGSSFSPRLKQILEGFRVRYSRATGRHQITYDRECQLLVHFANSIAAADPRLFYPLARLSALQDFEQGEANQTARDHFFHTFNNFLLGLVILDGLFSSRSNTAFPDRLIARRHNRSRLKLWESIWFITALFHDPGYIPQDFWSLFSFGYGLPHDPSGDVSIPPQVLKKIDNAWNTDFLRARNELLKVYRELTNEARARKSGTLVTARTIFDKSVRVAYFGKNRGGHSLLSGLILINRCLADQTVHHTHFDRGTAVTACNIACLGMLFHDQHCRETLLEAKVRPIPFSYLPYAAVLMFVDALQDDRRDVSNSRFRAQGVLDSLDVDRSSGIVTARVNLRNLPISQWAYRIGEYHSVMNWINGPSEIKFIINYAR